MSLPSAGETRIHARTPAETTIPALQALATRLGKDDELLAGQEVGAMAYLVHDALKEAGVRLLSFNAAASVS